MHVSGRRGAYGITHLMAIGYMEMYIITTKRTLRARQVSGASSSPRDRIRAGGGQGHALDRGHELRDGDGLVPRVAARGRVEDCVDEAHAEREALRHLVPYVQHEVEQEVRAAVGGPRVSPRAQNPNSGLRREWAYLSAMTVPTRSHVWRLGNMYIVHRRGWSSRKRSASLLRDWPGSVVRSQLQGRLALGRAPRGRRK